MSKISNKIIEAKLKKILIDETGADQPLKFNDDNIALDFIFNYYEDQISINQSLLEKNLDQIQELKVLEMVQRAEIDFYKQRENQARLNRNWDVESNKNRIIEESRKNENQWKRFQFICQDKEKMLAQSQKNKEQLEKKILQLSTQLDESQKMVELTKQQLESEREKDKQNKSSIKELKELRQQLISQHQKQVEKYKTEFMEEFTIQFNKKNTQHFQDLLKLNRQLQKELKNQENLFKDAFQKVSGIFKVPEPTALKEDLTIWVETINEKFEYLRTQIKKTMKEDIKQSEDPIKLLAEHKMKQIISRQFMITKYMNA